MTDQITARNKAYKLWAEQGKGLKRLEFDCPECGKGQIKTTVYGCGMSNGFCTHCDVEWDQ